MVSEDSAKKVLVIVGGPAGCGKSTVGNLLAEKIGCTFVEGDLLHPKENIEKMSHGIALTDDDRWDWLSKVAHEGAKYAESSKTNACVAACSSLKKAYRNHIRKAAPELTVIFVMIPVEKEELLKRVSQRKNHFMKADMVQGQLDIMEVPTEDEPNSLVYWNHVDIDDCVAKIKKIQESS